MAEGSNDPMNARIQGFFECLLFANSETRKRSKLKIERSPARSLRIPPEFPHALRRKSKQSPAAD